MEDSSPLKCEFCFRYYKTERGVRRHYILKHRYRYVRGQSPTYIACDGEYKRLCLREWQGQQHRRPFQQSSDDNNDEEPDYYCDRPRSFRRRAAAVPPVQSRQAMDTRGRQSERNWDRSLGRQPSTGRTLCGRFDETGWTELPANDEL